MYLARLLISLWLTVILSWDPNTEPDLAGYKVYRDGELIATLQGNTTTYTDSAGGSIYFIRAFNTAGQVSLNSNVVIVGSVTIY